MKRVIVEILIIGSVLASMPSLYKQYLKYRDRIRCIQIVKELPSVKTNGEKYANFLIDVECSGNHYTDDEILLKLLEAVK